MGFSRGDYVEYYDGHGVLEVGRVASVRDDGNVFVCFHTGCTAASCDPSRLAAIEPTEQMEAFGFGHHRFDDHCPEYRKYLCDALCPHLA